MRCDLHVHTVHSGMCTQPVARHFCRESYNHPEDVYHRLKALGMNLVTVTDHDSIGAAEILGRYPDFFPSEELSVVLPGGGRAHVSVYGLNEAQHVGIHRRFDDVPRLAAYLREQRLAFGVNHIFSALTGSRSAADFECFERCFPLLETRNGAMLPAANNAAARLALSWNKGATAGSDSHTLRGLASAFTEVRDARSKTEFLEGLRYGRGRVHGTSGGYCKLTADIAIIIANLFREKPWTCALAPVAAALPLVTFGNFAAEQAFAGFWCRRILGTEDDVAPSSLLHAETGLEVSA